MAGAAGQSHIAARVAMNRRMLPPHVVVGGQRTAASCARTTRRPAAIAARTNPRSSRRGGPRADRWRRAMPPPRGATTSAGDPHRPPPRPAAAIAVRRWHLDRETVSLGPVVAASAGDAAERRPPRRPPAKPMNVLQAGFGRPARSNRPTCGPHQGTSETTCSAGPARKAPRPAAPARWFAVSGARSGSRTA